jgi:hypothetical protein
LRALKIAIFSLNSTSEKQILAISRALTKLSTNTRNEIGNSYSGEEGVCIGLYPSGISAGIIEAGGMPILTVLGTMQGVTSCM